ncbi:MAG: asparaginase [Alicyclobacillus sp.]|nr:asparaginase [Alicyclobacillus sp.]
MAFRYSADPICHAPTTETGAGDTTVSERLVEVVRGGLVESWHNGDLAVVDTQGNVVWSVGDPDRIMYARSSAKPLQALPLVESGAADAFKMTSEELALACASHNGEAEHVDRIRAFLKRIGVDESHLHCGVHAPHHTDTWEAMLRRGEQAVALHNNCSGKHAGMLAMAKYLGADLDGYLSPDHPVQQEILRVVSEVCEVTRDHIHLGIDGCGVPVFALPLRKFAMAYARFANPDGQPQRRAEAMNRIARAMMAHPHLVAGTERFCTALMTVGNGRLLGKAGAEGVYCVGLLGTGHGICAKVDDGNSRGVYPAIVEALSQIGVLTTSEREALTSFHNPILKNHQGMVVGEIRPVFKLRQA